MKHFRNITIVGLGVIGGSYAISLSKLGYNVYGVDNNLNTITVAKDKGCIVDGGNQPQRFFAKSDLIVMALYPEQIADYLKNNIQFIQPNCVITDVAGLKSHFIEEIENVLPNNIQFVFCHPMAGREKKGFEFADDKVFIGANFIITPTERTSKDSIEKINTLVMEMGFGSVCMITPKEHDNIIAYTSQLPHALAVALINSDDEDSSTGLFIGDSYRDLTRIANINEKLWAELFLNNKDNLINAIEKFEFQLDNIKKYIKECDKKSLEKDFVKSTMRRINLEKTK